MTTKLPPYTRMHLNDPYLHASFVHQHKQTCEVCRNLALCVIIFNADLPTGVNVESTIIRSQADNFVVAIGLNCGCYAKFHRQIAYIISNVNRRRREEGKGQIPTL